MFLPFMCSLRVLEIHIDPVSAVMEDFNMLSFLIRSLRISLTSPATLEHLIFNIVFEGYGDDNFYYYSFFNDLRRDLWSHLDPIIIHPSSSRLQRVDINIDYIFQDNYSNVIPVDDLEVSEPILDALPLLREKGILFVKATEIWVDDMAWIISVQHLDPRPWGGQC